MILVLRWGAALASTLVLALGPNPAAASSSSYGTLQCDLHGDDGRLVLRSKTKEAEAGLEPKEVTIPRQKCRLIFPPTLCATYVANSTLPSAEAITKLSEPQPLALLVKMGVGSPFAGDRAEMLTKMVSDLAARGGVQLVFLIDRTQWTKKGDFRDAGEALPPALSELAVGYSVSDTGRIFPVKPLKDRAETPTKPRARAHTKYYETLSWSWWWETHGRAHASPGAAGAAGSGIYRRIWVVEDDTVFTGDWAKLLHTMEAGLAPLKGGAGADLVSFRDYCTPAKTWVWGRYMHEGVSNLTYPGKGLETWMTAYGLSPRFLDAVADANKEGTTGHIEWFPPTFALRHGYSLVFVQHTLRGQGLDNGCPGSSSPQGGTSTYCCSEKRTVDSENWFEGWKRAGGGTNVCVGPTLLHPVKGDACSRFSPNGFGRGCWARRGEGGGKYVDEFKAGHTDPKSAGFYKAYTATELERVLSNPRGR